MHFLQSTAWESFHQNLGNSTFRRGSEEWGYLAILEKSTLPKRLYLPYGPTASDVRTLGVAIDSLHALAKSQDAIFIRLQPTGVEITDRMIKKYDLREVDYSQPSITWRLDLTQDKDDIVAQMKQNNRNIYRNYTKKGMSYRRSTNPEDIPHLLRLLHEMKDRNEISIHSDKYLSTQITTLLTHEAASLHFITLVESDTIIAAALIYEGEDTNYYAHAASSFSHRKLNPATALLAEVVIDAKNQGRTTFDFFGITDSDDPKHRWAGFTKFKKSFGGYEFNLGKTYDIPVKKIPYQTYMIAKKVKQLL